MIVHGPRSALGSRESTAVDSRGHRRVLAVLECLENRFVPSGLELVRSPLAALVQEVGSPGGPGGSLVAVSSSMLTPVFAVAPSSGLENVVESVLDATAATVEGVTGVRGPEPDGTGPSIDAGSGGLGAGIALSNSGASLEFSVVPPNPGAEVSAPSIPTAPGASSSPANPAVPAVIPGASPMTGSSPSTTPTNSPNPGVAAGPVVSAPPSTGATPPSAGFVVQAPGAREAAVPVPGPVSTALPEDAQRFARGRATATSSSPLSDAHLSPAQLVAADRAATIRARHENEPVVAGSFETAPSQPVVLEPAREVPPTPAELFVRELEGLERALGALSGQLGRLGDGLAEQLVQISTLELLVAAGLGCLAFEVLRRRERQKERQDPRAQLGAGSLPGPFYRPRMPLA